MKTKYLPLLALALGISAWTLNAQDDKQPPPPPPDSQMGGDNGAQPPPPPPDNPNAVNESGTNAQPPPPQGHWLPLIYRALLKGSKDGIISAETIANAPAILKSLDKNGDGKLTRDEYMGPPPPPPPQDAQQGGQNTGNAEPPAVQSGSQQSGQGQQAGPPPGQRPKHPPVWPIIQALDVDHDGTIDASEIANASEELLTLDKNQDGKLTPDEYMPHPPKPPKNSQQTSGGQGNNQPPPPPPPPPPGGGRGH